MHFATSEDYASTSLPEDYPSFSNGHYPAFGDHGVQYTAQQPGFVGPPTPPGQQNSHLAGHTAWPPTAAVTAAAQPVTPASATPSAAASMTYLDQAKAQDAFPAATRPDPSLLEEETHQYDQNRRGSSKSDDDDMAPAQSRRKAQNRAAQRAFRERKERHVKELEAKLASLEASQTETVSENERLRRELQKASTENEILRATSSLNAAAVYGTSPRSDGGLPLTAGPMTYSPNAFYSDLLANHNVKTPSHRIVASDSGERLLGAGATWDLIVGHESFQRGLIDVADISNLLKSQAKCDGQGPVFEERAIYEAIEQSVRSGSDSLL
ncbi:AP-1-like transcription factor [Sporothrix epigloea]|uniref:AP-1-like transcription factor n=1 Tax=Sporothrix epigloea TaxID=1892477 RepID=A0ABP0E065_9PEZI